MLYIVLNIERLKLKAIFTLTNKMYLSDYTVEIIIILLFLIY
jgi:hypothetical protein